jgi:hypothetical protein
MAPPSWSVAHELCTNSRWRDKKDVGAWCVLVTVQFECVWRRLHPPLCVLVRAVANIARWSAHVHASACMQAMQQKGLVYAWWSATFGSASSKHVVHNASKMGCNPPKQHSHTGRPGLNAWCVARHCCAVSMTNTHKLMKDASLTATVMQHTLRVTMATFIPNVHVLAYTAHVSTCRL